RNSIRHAVYVDVRRRMSDGLMFTANYTFGKSIDGASDAGPDVRVLTTGSTRGQVSYGGPRSGDRAISPFYIKHKFTSAIVYEMPFGEGGPVLRDAPQGVNGVAGGWQTPAAGGLQSGGPILPLFPDTHKKLRAH